MPRDRSGSAQDNPPVVGAIPVEIGRSKPSARRRLADLARSADEGHLTVPCKMVRKNMIVQPRAGRHGPSAKSS